MVARQAPFQDHALQHVGVVPQGVDHGVQIAVAGAQLPVPAGAAGPAGPARVGEAQDGPLLHAVDLGQLHRGGGRQLELGGGEGSVLGIPAHSSSTSLKHPSLLWSHSMVPSTYWMTPLAVNVQPLLTFWNKAVVLLEQPAALKYWVP